MVKHGLAWSGPIYDTIVFLWFLQISLELPCKCNGNHFASLALANHLMLAFFSFFIELDSEFRQDIFTEDDYHYLNVPVVGSFTVDNTFDCTLKCLRNPCCFSVNLAAYRGANGKIWCELLSSEKHSNPEKYKRNQTSHHLSTILEV